MSVFAGAYLGVAFLMCLVCVGLGAGAGYAASGSSAGATTGAAVASCVIGALCLVAAVPKP